MQSLERYFYLIVFNAYLHEQVQFVFLCANCFLLFSKSAKPLKVIFEFYYTLRFCSILSPSCPPSASGCAAMRGCTGYSPAWTCQSCRPRLSWLPKELVSWWGNQTHTELPWKTQVCLGRLCVSYQLRVTEVFVCLQVWVTSNSKIIIETYASVQVADECLAPDVLSTMKEMKAVNFRRVPKMPVYGMAQPTSEVQQINSCSCIFVCPVMILNQIICQQHLEASEKCLFHKLLSKDDYLLIIRWCWLTNQEKGFSCDLRTIVFEFASPFLYFPTNMINGCRSDVWWFG